VSAAGAAAVEARVRRVVADTLGVGDHELTPEVSLADDLAADSLDLVEMAIELEGELGIMLPDRILDHVRTFGELVTATLSLTRRTRDDEDRARRRPMLVRTGVVAPRGKGTQPRGPVRTEWLTPYDIETIAEDAKRAGRGARLDVVVPFEAGTSAEREVEERFARLRRQGLDLAIHRADDEEASPAQHRRAGTRSS
jgi:acyl carrier protein